MNNIENKKIAIIKIISNIMIISYVGLFALQIILPILYMDYNYRERIYTILKSISYFTTLIIIIIGIIIYFNKRKYNIYEARMYIINKLKLVLILFLAYFCLIQYLNSCTLYYLPEGRINSEVSSPNNTYTAKAYDISGGALSSYSVRVEVINNKTKKRKNIYYIEHLYKFDIKWINEKTIKINGIKLNVEKDIYDYRKED